MVISLLRSSLFPLQMIMKISAIGMTQYWRQKWNRFDGTIVILSLPDLVIFPLAYSHSGGVTGENTLGGAGRLVVQKEGEKGQQAIDDEINEHRLAC